MITCKEGKRNYIYWYWYELIQIVRIPLTQWPWLEDLQRSDNRNHKRNKIHITARSEPNPLKPYGLVKAKSIERLRRQRVQYGADPAECSDKSGLALRQIAFIYYAVPKDGCRTHTPRREEQNLPLPHLTYKWPLLDFTDLTTSADQERPFAVNLTGLLELGQLFP
jgi:hypothetical protein